MFISPPHQNKGSSIIQMTYILVCFVQVINYLTAFQIMKSEVLRVTHELQAMKDKIKENSEKIKVNKTLPYLVSNVIEVSVLIVCFLSQQV